MGGCFSCCKGTHQVKEAPQEKLRIFQEFQEDEKSEESKTSVPDPSPLDITESHLETEEKLQISQERHHQQPTNHEETKENNLEIHPEEPINPGETQQKTHPEKPLIAEESNEKSENEKSEDKPRISQERHHQQPKEPISPRETLQKAHPKKPRIIEECKEKSEDEKSQDLGLMSLDLDILLEIMKKLPIEDKLRLRHSDLQPYLLDPVLLDEVSVQRSNTLVLIIEDHYDMSSFQFNRHRIDFLHLSEQNCYIERHMVSPFSPCSYNSIGLIGCARGLIVLYGIKDSLLEANLASFMILNPVTQEAWQLPDLELRKKKVPVYSFVDAGYEWPMLMVVESGVEIHQFNWNQWTWFETGQGPRFSLSDDTGDISISRIQRRGILFNKKLYWRVNDGAGIVGVDLEKELENFELQLPAAVSKIDTLLTVNGRLLVGVADANHYDFWSYDRDWVPLGRVILESTGYSWVVCGAIDKILVASRMPNSQTFRLRLKSELLLAELDETAERQVIHSDSLVDALEFVPVEQSVAICLGLLHIPH